MKLLRNVAMLPAGMWDSEKILRRHNFDAAFGVGGYAAGPMMLAAALHGIPTVVFEPNAEPGFTNRVLAGMATRIAAAIRDRASASAARRWSPASRAPGIFRRCRRKEHREPFHILITGGSQGACRSIAP